MPLFYAPDILTESILPEQESQHAVRVLRLKAGDTIELVDGAGSTYKAIISEPHPKRCRVEVVERIQNSQKRDYRLHIAIAPTKNMDRMEWFVEKCTEIGVDEITPLLCRFSERKVIKPERLDKIIISASKQSLKAYFPKLNPMIKFNEFIKQSHNYHLNAIAHCYNGEKPLLQEVYKVKSDVMILIGPEGDFSQEEVKSALNSGFQAISLGSSRLRTETAGVVACHTIELLNQL